MQIVKLVIRTLCAVAAAVTATTVAYADPDISICKDIVSVIDHPATIIAEKVKRGGLTCLAAPHCCGPTWEAHPECYLIENRNVKDAWSEVQHKTQCTPATAMTAVKEIVLARVNPTGLAFTPDLYEAYRAFVDLSSVSASRLPSDVKLRLSRIVGKPGILWEQQDLDHATYLRASDARGSVLFPGTYGNKDIAGITHGTLIVIADRVLSDNTCDKYATFAHELTHIFQNRREGENSFLTKYLLDASHYSYRNIPYEAEAFALQDNVLNNYCPQIMR